MNDKPRAPRNDCNTCRFGDDSFLACEMRGCLRHGLPPFSKWEPKP